MGIVGLTTQLPVLTVGPRVAIIGALSESLALRGYPPTIREIREKTGLQLSVIHRHLERLRVAGYVTWTDGQPRTLRFQQPGEDLMPVRKVKGGYKWGQHGKVYKTKAGAQRQARAAYASGYKSKRK